MRVVLFGLGVVGRSFVRLLAERSEHLVRVYGMRPRIVAAADSAGLAVDPRGLEPAALLATKERGAGLAGGADADARAARLRELDAEVYVDALPTDTATGEPAMTYLRAALSSGKHAICANKGPLALAHPALAELAAHNGVTLRFSATVGGGTPVLDFADRCRQGDRVLSLRGILNGTTNYILSRMTREGTSFDAALAAAQAAGYAETDPSADVDGLDTARKLVILANAVMGRRATLRDCALRGIRGVSAEEVRDAVARGGELKLIGSIGERLEVAPRWVSRDDPLCVGGTLNAVSLVCETSGEKTIAGKGAGGPETATAILRDLLEIREKLR
ncbi:MAG: homoserine dehydrogenase [Planctomycetes bacterium]|nr:homoserine dehydrogenase [Planctomycetota bacterium]